MNEAMLSILLNCRNLLQPLTMDEQYFSVDRPDNCSTGTLTAFLFADDICRFCSLTFFAGSGRSINVSLCPTLFGNGNPFREEIRHSVLLR